MGKGPRKPQKKRLFVTVMMLGIAALLLYQAGLFVMIVWFNFFNPGSTAFMGARLTELKATESRAVLHYQWTPYGQISKSLKQAVIASEDANFIEHEGVEWNAIRKAWEFNRKQSAKGAARMRGGSTITQQLAKNLFLSSSRSYVRKAQELVLAYMIEAVMSKQRILELYLNVAQWGSDVFGAESAARHYYQTSAARLGPAQSARLAAMLPNPAYYDARGDTAYLRSRTRTIRQRMRQVEIPSPQ